MKKNDDIEIYEEVIDESQIGDEEIIEEADLEGIDPASEHTYKPSEEKKKTGKKSMRKVSAGGDKNRKKLSLHQCLLIASGVVFLLSILSLVIWNIGTRYVETTAEEQAEFDTEKMDYITTVDLEGVTGYVEDDVRTVLCLGNAPFADDYGTEDNLCSMIQEMAKDNTVVLNASIAESCMGVENLIPTRDYPIDALSLYYLTQYFAMGTKEAIEVAELNMGGFTDAHESASEGLDDVDMSKVDVIAIFYDATDYLQGRYAAMPNPEDLTTYVGALNASVNLIQQQFPWIRIIVMSPAYAYCLDENGNYVDSDKIGDTVQLSAYVQYMQSLCYEKLITLVDNFYGTIPETKAKKYLTDNIHINVEGRKLLAKRFVEALEYFD